MSKMSSFGSQVITHTLSSEYDPSEVNIQQYNIIPYGIYDGLELSINGPDSVQISGPGVGVVYDEVNDLAVQFQQKDNLNIDVNTTEPYLVARWEYNQSLTNPVRYETDTQAGLASTDVVLGKVLFDQNDEVSGFDLSERVERDLENVEGFDTEADEGALFQSDGNGNVITVLSTQSNNTLARYNDSSGEWEAIQTDTSNTGNTVVERNSDGDINGQGINGVTISASDVFQWIQSLNGSNQTFLDLSPDDLNNSWTFEWIESSNSIRATSPDGNVIFLNNDGTIQHADANNNNESATLGQVPDQGITLGTNSGQLNYEYVDTGAISSGSVVSISFNFTYSSDDFMMSLINSSTSESSQVMPRSALTDGNGNYVGWEIYNPEDDPEAGTFAIEGIIA